ncbi:YqiA/YcfP family alpha/beta fold hydrolase [Sedimentibacter sp.]|uniref:alpha/beta hydrolase family protein n=1 Tax=Sedimentibacter sp. TaxID=1960295 RepID=UPI0028B073D5|nr:YqiA/YcfP family alpha/beta fold hydrolase [Sedimentibacter sp.]
MIDYIKSNFIREEKIKIQGIPAIIFRPIKVEEPIPTIIFYHGWSSNKELQRLRGFILSSVGYQVVIPDAIYHGERSRLNDYSWDMAKEYFWDVIFRNLDEFNIIVRELVSKYSADSKRIAVMGNSMGGFTAGGIFTHNKNVKTLVVFNGSCGWENFNNNIEKPIDKVLRERYDIIEKKVKDMDPMNYLNLLKNRPILLMHGDSDNVVPVKSQKDFYNKLNLLYEDNDKIKFVEYTNLNHFVTTNMMEESINWLGRYL